MNKKLAITGLSIALGSVMLITTAFAGSTTTSGYEAYKSAIKNTITTRNFTENAVITASDNGKVLAAVNNTAKLGGDKQTMSQSTTVKIGDQTNTFETYRQDGKMISKTSGSDVYNVMTFGQRKDSNGKEGDEKQLDSSKIKDGEMLVDALVGNLQNYVTLDSKADGTKDISVQLSDSQIPTLANTAASIFVKNAVNKENKMGNEKGISSVEKSLIADMPKLVDGIRINSVNLKAEINKDNYIVNQVADISISGKDANGADHTITVDINMNMSDFNSTTPDKIDLTGKQTQTVTPHKGEFRHQGEEQSNTQN